jgi:hypothetical protein
MNIPIPAPNAATALNTIISSWKEYSIIKEQEKTKRENIRAFRDTNIRAIEENSAFLKAYLEKTFFERSVIINKMFERLDTGITTGNVELISVSIAAIVDITKQSPLNSARELLNNYRDPRVTRIEI